GRNARGRSAAYASGVSREQVVQLFAPEALARPLGERLEAGRTARQAQQRRCARPAGRRPCPPCFTGDPAQGVPIHRPLEQALRDRHQEDIAVGLRGATGGRRDAAYKDEVCAGYRPPFARAGAATVAGSAVSLGRAGRPGTRPHHRRDAPGQTARRLRPLARRARMTARPPRVFILTRKPWVRLRRVTDGWKVRFMSGIRGRRASSPRATGTAAWPGRWGSNEAAMRKKPSITTYCGTSCQWRGRQAATGGVQWTVGSDNEIRRHVGRAGSRSRAPNRHHDDARTLARVRPPPRGQASAAAIQALDKAPGLYRLRRE